MVYFFERWYRSTSIPTCPENGNADANSHLHKMLPYSEIMSYENALK